jgi:rSAM/selenodomain-associated transferase 1
VDSLQGSAPVLSYGPLEARSFFQEFVPPHFSLVPQLGAELGARLLSTFEQLFRQGFDHVFAIDSDTPTLPSTYLQHALDAMAQPQTDVVLGPTEDGGYYLLGLRRLHRQLFEEMPWSTPQVLIETLRRAEAQQLHTICVEPWFDVDTPDDLHRLMEVLRASHNGEAPHTQRFLWGHQWGGDVRI